MPAYHSRRMSQLISQTGWASEYNELPDHGHWFDGVMTTPALRKFYHHALAVSTDKSQSCHDFTLVVANPGTMGPKCGLAVDQLESPDQYGRIDVETHNTVWSIETSNIHRFHMTPIACWGRDSLIVLVDGGRAQFQINCKYISGLMFFRSTDGLWMVRSLSSCAPPT